MSNDKSNINKGKTPPPPPPSAGNKPGTPAVSSAPPPPPLFRRIDWIAFGLTTLLVFIGYLLTLAPDLTLEDSGELAVGSYYAGVPHPPGYPLWTLYTWLFTVLLPFSNIAWRVAVSSAVAAAFACGLLALIVSRGSSMMIEGISDLKGIDRRWENLICLVSGFVSGMLIGFNGFMWSQAVIVEVYTLSVLSLMAVLACLMRWLYDPSRLRYLYLSAFFFGLCFTNHQTLIVAAMGIEVAILAVNLKLGRDLFLANSIVYLLGLYAKSKGMLTSFDNNLPLFTIYNLVGLGSILTCAWAGFKTRALGTEWKPILIISLLWVAGASFYLYMPIASMTNPPMNWGYPRTVEGFFHAFSRGQYERTNPTSDVGKLFSQLRMYGEGAVEEFNFVYLVIGLVPFLLFRRMQKREQAWMVGLSAIYLCLAVLLLILLNPTTDKQSRDLTKVFFTASYVMISIWIGYGLTLSAAFLLLHYERIRPYALYALAGASGIAIYSMASTLASIAYPLIVYTSVFGVILAIAALALIYVNRQRAPMAILLGLFALMPTYTIMAHWADNEQRGHLFGFWFGHDMFTPPFDIYPEMTRNAILFGGTDPGRFCPTYMIFCESFIPPAKRRDPNFDRRDVYIITQNALADHTYLNYIRAHYNRSTQIDPPFFQELFRTQRSIEDGTTNFLARLVAPLDHFFLGLGARIEARRRAEGVYPPDEIHTPTPEDSKKCFDNYIMDAQRRLAANQLKAGENVAISEGKVQVSGQVAVMQINGLLTKVIFDKNPTNEFFVEESFPLDWMYPYLSPFGIIMKINRQPLEEITQEMVDKDHQFWSKYSERLIGNWITYDTTVKEICDFAEKTYLRRDLRNFKGDPKFVRDNDAQKAFSKLRSAIAGVYDWRLRDSMPGSPAYQRMLKEADFAFRQAFAFCPFSPEALFRYINLLAATQRWDDALLIAETCLKFDPENQGVQDVFRQLSQIKQSQISQSAVPQQPVPVERQGVTNTTNPQDIFNMVATHLANGQTNRAMIILDQLIAQLEPTYQANPSNAQVAFHLASAYAQRQKPNLANEVLEKITKYLEARHAEQPTNPSAALELSFAYIQRLKFNEASQVLDRLLAAQPSDPSLLLSIATAWAQLGNAPKLEQTLTRLVAVVPDNPEAHYDLAAIQAVQNKPKEALATLQRALQLSKQRLAQQPGSKDLIAIATQDGRFLGLRDTPEFKKMIKE